MNQQHSTPLNPDLYREKITHCPLCNSHAIVPHYAITHESHPFYVDKCGTCDFIFMNPQFHTAVIEKFYSEDYYKGKASYSYCDEREMDSFSKHVWDKRIQKIHRYKESGNFLDIGSSFGGLLRSARKYYSVYGIEMSPYSAAYARETLGPSIHNGTLKDHPFDRNNFDVITMIELIEHVADPLEAIEECFKLLKDKGILVIQTANMKGWQAKQLKDEYAYYMPGHLSYFSQDNLSDVLKRCGFSRIKTFYPVEFGLLPKLLKSRHSFKSLKDYRAWLRISSYHVKSKIHIGSFAMTSSMVIYAFK